MASLHKTYKISADLADAADLLAARNGYASGGALIKGLIRYAALCQSRHAKSLEWAGLPLVDQDRLDAALFALVKAEKGMTSIEAAKVTFAGIIARADGPSTNGKGSTNSAPV